MSQLLVAPAHALQPARTLRELIHNCDKDAPLATDDPRFQDLSVGRGDSATEMLAQDLSTRKDGQFVHAAFVSHRGAGKTTEIQRIAHLVKDVCHTVYIEATVEMDPLQIEAEDLLLNIALAVEAEMRRIGRPLPADLLGRVEKWFSDAMRTTQWSQGYNAEVAAGAEGKLEIDEFDGPGRDLLEQALARRIDLDRMIPAKEVRDRLIAASGGGIRELLDLVSTAARLAKGAALEEADVERAIARRKQRLRDQINVNGFWPTLRTIAETKQISEDKHCLSVLYHRLAFKYNADGWYDVHPLVTELPEFRPAIPESGP